jgi:hypothetical protein
MTYIELELNIRGMIEETRNKLEKNEQSSAIVRQQN